MKLKLICTSITFLFLLTIVNIVSASPDNWVEVNRWSGEAFPEPNHLTTGNFVCDHVEWRIRWIYTATGSPFESFLVIQVYEQGNPESIDLIYKSSYFSQSGTNNIRNNSGTFYMNGTIANIEEYTIIVEQNVDSIPTPTPVPTSQPTQSPTSSPSPTPSVPEVPIWIILALVTTATLLTVLFIRRKKSPN